MIQDFLGIFIKTLKNLNDSGFKLFIVNSFIYRLAYLTINALPTAHFKHWFLSQYVVLS